MLGHRYFGARYFGPRYFGPDVEDDEAPAAGEGGYFGHRYFGAPYFGPRYYGPALDGGTQPEPATTPAPHGHVLPDWLLERLLRAQKRRVRARRWKEKDEYGVVRARQVREPRAARALAIAAGPEFGVAVARAVYAARAVALEEQAPVDAVVRRGLPNRAVMAFFIDQVGRG